MLEADSALYSTHLYNNHGVFAEAIAESTDEIISHLESALVDRRTRLYTLATSQLSPQELEELNVADDRLLDEKATDVYAALEQRKFSIPPALRTPFIRTTLFHRASLSPGLRESLYRRGFIDVDGISSYGLTPLMDLGYRRDDCRLKPTLQRVSWLISKGADPGRTPDQSRCTGYDPNVTAAHYICSWIADALYQSDPIKPWWVSRIYLSRAWLFRILDGLEDECQSVFGKLFCSRFYDDYLCACSSHGCTPATMMLKGIMKEFHLQPKFGKCVDLVEYIEWCIWVIEWMNSLLSHSCEAWHWLSHDIIRYLTFEKLGLTHTCCECYFSGFPRPTRFHKTERAEIHEEERFTISKLDTLVTEFEEKYTELGVSVPDFLNGYWKTRMEEVEWEDEPLDEEQIAKIRDLGVVIHS